MEESSGDHAVLLHDILVGRGDRGGHVLVGDASSDPRSSGNQLNLVETKSGLMVRNQVWFVTHIGSIFRHGTRLHSRSDLMLPLHVSASRFDRSKVRSAWNDRLENREPESSGPRSGRRR